MSVWMHDRMLTCQYENMSVCHLEHCKTDHRQYHSLSLLSSFLLASISICYKVSKTCVHMSMKKKSQNNQYGRLGLKNKIREKKLSRKICKDWSIRSILCSNRKNPFKTLPYKHAVSCPQSALIRDNNAEQNLCPYMYIRTNQSVSTLLARSALIR